MNKEEFYTTLKHQLAMKLFDLDLLPEEANCATLHEMVAVQLLDGIWEKIQEAVSYADRRCPYDCEGCHMGPDGMCYDHPDDMPE